MFALIRRFFNYNDISWKPYRPLEPIDIGGNNVLTGPVMRKVSSSGTTYRAMTAEEETDFEYWQAVK